MLAGLCYLYAGTTPDYWLDRHSLEEWQMFIAYGEEAAVREAETQARITGAAVAYAWAGKTMPALPHKPLIVTVADETPDRAKLHQMLKFTGGRASR